MHGFVHDSNGKPINDAEIQIDDRKKIVHSNTNGAFWRLLLPGMRFRTEIQEPLKYLNVWLDQTLFLALICESLLRKL